MIAPPERKECIEKSAFSPAARAWLFKACVISAADMGALPRMGAPPSPSREMLGNKYPRVISHPMADPMGTSCSTAVTGHVAKQSWLYATEIRWSAPSLMVLPHWKLKRNPLRFGSLRMRCMSVRLSSSPRFVASKATVNRARSRARPTRVYGSDVHCNRALNGDTMVCK